MLTMKNKKYIYTTLLSASQLKMLKETFDGMFGVKAGQGYINWFVRASIVIFKKKRPSITRASFVFIRDIHRMYNKSSRKFVVLYLKTCHVLLMQSVGGYHVQDCQLIGGVRVSRTKCGLPRLIPKLHREEIRKGNVLYIKLYLTLFSLYRLIAFKSVVSLDTIIDPGVVLSDNLVCDFRHAAIFLFKSIGVNVTTFAKDMKSPIPYWIIKTSPTSSPSKEGGFTSWLNKKLFDTPKSLYDDKKLSVKGKSTNKSVCIDNMSTTIPSIILSAYRLHSHPVLWEHFKQFCTVYENQPLVKWIEEISSSIRRLLPSFSEYKTGPLGKLGLIHEAAGKVRVVAMVECWTQWALRPLHDSLFSILDKFPTDGTMDQLKPVNRLISQGHTRFWCYDLSAATDRLPVSIQEVLLQVLIGETASSAWRSLLTLRKYYLPRDCYKHNSFKKNYGSHVTYTVGQPMGALSSWAMLALTHHFMVAVAAKRAGFSYGTFWAYAVLGDDIVIANGLVAREYLLICTQLGVKVGIHKSLISKKGVLEFAKRLMVRGVDSSPVSLLELASGSSSVLSALEIAKKYSLSFQQLSSILGYGYRALGSLTKPLRQVSPRLRHLGILFFSPFGVNCLDPFTWLNLNNFIHNRADPTAPEGYDKIMRSRCEKLYSRFEALRGPIGDFRGTYSANRAISVYNKMVSWFEECGISSTSPMFGVVYPIVRTIVDPIVLNFRKNLADGQGNCSSITYSSSVKPDDLIKWNDTRHGLSLATNLSSPNLRKSGKLVSASHVWDMWRHFPKRSLAK